MAAPAPVHGSPSNAPGPNDGFFASIVHPAQTWIRSMDWNRDPRAGGGIKSWTRSKKTDPKRRKQLIAAYLPDWIITFLLAGLLAILNKAHGYWRPFNLQDATIQFAYAVEERVTTGELVVYTVIIPIIILAIWTLLIHKSTWELHISLLSFILSQALTLTATTIIKITVGRPRPDILDRCQPRPGSMNAQPFGLATADICTSTDFAILRDGFRSFPSGHASTAFCGMTFMALYFTAKLRTTRQEAISSWLAFVFMMAAALIAISRTMDHRHHAADVIAGGILGTIIAIFTYHRYYPLLWSSRCYRPYPPRVPRSSDDEDPALTPLHRYDPHLPTHHEHHAYHAGRDDLESRPFGVQHSHLPANGHSHPPHSHGAAAYDVPPVVAPPAIGVPADQAARNSIGGPPGAQGAGGYYHEPGYRTG